MKGAHERLEVLGQAELLDDLSARWGLPHAPEFELRYFRNLFSAELFAALEEAEIRLDSTPCASTFARRGRLRRLIGDASGAVHDFEQALDRDPSHPEALLWLGEADLGSPQALRCLTRAVERGADRAYLYRGAAHLLDKDRKSALRDLALYLSKFPGSCLGRLLAGKAARAGAARTHFAAAAAAAPSCAAAHVLHATALRGADADRAMERALDADPTLALITLSWYRPGSGWSKHLRKLREFALAEPESVAWYYRQEEIRYSPYHLEEYADAQALARERPRAWALALVGRGACRCPPDAARAVAGLEALRSAVAASPASGWLYAWRALAWIQNGRPETALEDFNKAVQLQPYYHRAYAWRGALLRKLGRHSEALSDLDRALAVDELYAFAWNERSLVRRGLGDWAGAAWDLDRAFLLDHRYRWVFTVGREPSGTETDAALAQLDAALSELPSVPSLWVWRGQLKLDRGDLPGSFQDFERALSLEPRCVLAQAWQGRGLFFSGHLSEAAGRLRDVLRSEPRLWIAYAWLADAEAAMGMLPQALRTLEGARRRKPTSAWILEKKGDLHMAQGQPRRALEALEKAVSLEGRHADTYELLARARFQVGDIIGAEQAVEKALFISPNHGRAFLLRAAIRERRGDHGRVLEDYRTALERFPYLFNKEQRRGIEALLHA